MTIHNIIFYGSYLIFPFIGLLFWLWKRGVKKWIIISLGILSVLFIDARFIEPRMIVVNEHDYTVSESSTESIRVAVISDMHVGVYRSPKRLQQEVDKINKANPDMVFIAGDFIYYLPEDQLAAAFAAYQHIQAPIFAVAGNHDSKRPGDIDSNILRSEVAKNNIHFIDNTMSTFSFAGKEIDIIGFSDLWEGQSHFTLLEDVNPNHITIALVHNPDAVYEFPNYNADLVLAGHTHAGQVRIPFLYKYAIPTEHDFDKGWYNFDNMKLFITAGTGMVGLPFRFLNPPQIDIINLHI